jgi:hypothetical protein
MGIYEGTVNSVEVGQNWTIIKTRENQKPLGLRSFQGELPRPNQYISVQANEGRLWWFGEHRTLVIRDTPRPTFIVIEHYPQLKLQGKSGRAAEIILAKFHLEGKTQVTGDDIVGEIAAAFPDNNPRIAGIGFQVLSKQRIIHVVGWARSQYGHHRQNPVWELTRKG